MIEAGADQVPEDTMLLAFELAHTEIKRICDVIDDLREQVGKPKWVDPALTAELEATHGDAIWQRIQAQGLKAAEAIVDEIVDEICPDDHARLHRGRHGARDAGQGRSRAGARQAAPRGRRGPGARAVRDRAARADRRGAGLEVPQVAQARHPLRQHRRRASACRSRPPTETRTARTRPRRRGSRRRPTRSTRTSSARRSRSTSGAPTAAARRRSARSTSRSASLRARTARACSRAARRRS